MTRELDFIDTDNGFIDGFPGFRKVGLAIGFALALAGCTTTAPPPAGAPVASSDSLSGLAKFTVADLQAASADAHAQTPPDETAFRCYDFLITAIPTLTPSSSGNTVGAFVAFQKLRDLHNGVSSAGGALKSLTLACAPLVIDTQTVVNKLLLLGAGTFATGGAVAPFVGMIP